MDEEKVDIFIDTVGGYVFVKDLEGNRYYIADDYGRRIYLRDWLKFFYTNMKVRGEINE